ncbi:MAG: hypothetical protein ACM3QU_01470 [Verrucomicrobiota bacterium]
MEDPGQRFTPGDDGQTYAEERRQRLHRHRMVGYAVCVPLWLLSAVPLARLSSDQGGGLGVTAIYLAAGLAIAIVFRAVYARWAGRPFWSPWLFVIAAVLALASYGVQSAGEKAAAPSAISRSAL